MRAFRLRLPQIVFGIGSLKTIGDECRRLKAKKIFISTDKGIVKAGLLDEIVSPLKGAGMDIFVYDKVEPNPKAEIIDGGAKIYHKERCDLIIGFGGGSSMDTAKGIAIMSRNEGSILDYQSGQKQFTNAPSPFIEVPTTAGTGSEVTCSAVITNDKLGKKFVVYDPNLIASLAIVDPKLTLNLPPKFTAETGADALSHAIEAYVCTWSNQISNMFSLKALELIANNLEKAFANGKNVEARSNMMLASTLAGMAIASSGLGILHSIVHAIGGRHDLSHGMLCGLLLPRIMEFNLVAEPSKFADIARAFGFGVCGLPEIDAGKKAIDAVKSLLKEVKIPERLREIGVSKKELQEIAMDAAEDKILLEMNPRKASVEEIIEILERSF